MRMLLAPIVVLPLVLGPPALAQGAPSADHVINSLRPTGNLIQGGTRGIRAGAPSATATAPVTPRAPHVAPSQPTPTREAAQQ